MTKQIPRRDFMRSVVAAFAAPHVPNVKRPSSSPQVQFRDIAHEAGIKFRHDNAATPEKYLIETMGSGCGWIDYDQNGLLDLYLVNGAATKVYTPPHALRSALYRNNGDGTFTDVTEKSGVAAEGLFGMGVAVGDYDNDGYPDLYVLGYDRSILYRNNGDGTFTDDTTRAGVPNRGSIMTTMAGWTWSWRTMLTGRPTTTSGAANMRPDAAVTASPTRITGSRRRCFTTMATERSRMSAKPRASARSRETDSES